MNYYRFLVSSLLLSVTCVSFGFESDIHGDISLKALEVIKRCQIDISPIQSAQQIAVGSVQEDTTEKVTRLANWHFYDTYKTLKQGPVVYESLDHIFRIRNERFFQGLTSMSSTEKSHSLGRVLHYIQDMSVPAHVVPVFHGKPFAQDDAFDHFQLSELEKNKATQQIECSDIIKKSTDLKNRVNKNLSREEIVFETNSYILQEAVQFTLSRVNSRINNQSVAWNYFWREPELKTISPFDISSVFVGLGRQSKRFGTYVGTFGRDSQVIDYQKNIIPVRKEDYNNFYRTQYQQAVKNSAVLILSNVDFFKKNF
jgi:hypothetical protein